MMTVHQNAFPSRSVLTYRSGSCQIASRITRKYRRNSIHHMKKTGQHLVWLAYLKFLDSFGQQLREHVVNNRIQVITPTDIRFVYRKKMKKFLG